MEPLPLIPRLEARTIIDPDSGCFIWTGPTHHGGENDYGQISYKGQTRPTHVAAWEELVGPIPDGLVLDHVVARGCKSRRCWNVAHLEPVTHVVNTLRGNSPMALNARKTACPAGHPYDEKNTSIRGGSRICRRCERARAAATYREKREALGKPVNDVLQRDRTHCPKGHPYDEANTVLRGNRRGCRECNRAASREAQRKKRQRLRDERGH